MLCLLGHVGEFPFTLLSSTNNMTSNLTGDRWAYIHSVWTSVPGVLSINEVFIGQKGEMKECVWAFRVCYVGCVQEVFLLPQHKEKSGWCELEPGENLRRVVQFRADRYAHRKPLKPDSALTSPPESFILFLGSAASAS